MTLYEEQKKLESLEGDIERYNLIVNNFMNNPQSKAFSKVNYKYLLTMKVRLSGIKRNQDIKPELSKKAYELSSKLDNLVLNKSYSVEIGNKKCY